MFTLSPIARRVSTLFIAVAPLTGQAADADVELTQMVVTATRTEQDIREVPARGNHLKVARRVLAAATI